MHFAQKSVVVTGAAGSIGSQICEQIIKTDARQLKMVSLTESGLYNINRRLRALGTDCEIVPILGNVGDRFLMDEVLRDVDIVIHAAAHKHIPICQQNPIAAIENNVFGTYTLAKASRAAAVDQFVLISTDKAVRPISIMGATKRVSELILRDLFPEYTDDNTRFCVVRFGNVIDSDGSVLPLWREQIARGGPITVTDPDCERYFMSIPEAVDLVLGVVSMNPTSGTFIFNMGSRKKLIHMAAELIAASGKQIAIEYIGLRSGENLIEELHDGGCLTESPHPKIIRVLEKASAVLTAELLMDLWAETKARNTNSAVDLLYRMVK